MKENADRIQWADPEHSATSEKKESNPDNRVDSEESEEERQTLKRVRGNNGEITTIRMRELQDDELQIHEQEIRRNKRVLEQQPELIREIQETYQSLCETRRTEIVKIMLPKLEYMMRAVEVWRQRFNIMESEAVPEIFLSASLTSFLTREP